MTQDRTLTTGPIKFDPNLKTNTHEVPDDQDDPDATVVRANDKRAHNPEFGRWLRQHGVSDDRTVTRIEIRFDLKVVIAYRIKGVFRDDDFMPLTTKDGDPIHDTAVVIRLAGLHDLPPGVTAP